jgi:hypothetical protein
MLRQAQHARIFVNHFKSISARPEPVEGLRLSFSTACKDATPWSWWSWSRPHGRPTRGPLLTRLGATPEKRCTYSR